MGTRRQVARLAARPLQPEAKVIDLADAAPYGAVLAWIRMPARCACVRVRLPVGRACDNHRSTQLRFKKMPACNCGLLLANICPEDAITLKPQLN